MVTDVDVSGTRAHLGPLPEWAYGIFHQHSCPRANWIVCCMPVAMCIINVILYSLSAVTKPNSGLRRPPIMWVVCLPAANQ